MPTSPLRRRNSYRVVLSVDLTMRSMVVEVDPAYIVPIRKSVGGREAVVSPVSVVAPSWKLNSVADVMS